MGVAYSAGVVFGTPVSPEVYERLYGLFQAADDWEAQEYLFCLDELSGEGHFLGVLGAEVELGEYIRLEGEIIPADCIEEFAAKVREYNVPVDQFGYYMVSRVF